MEKSFISITKSIEDYLKAIYELSGKDSLVSTSALASYLEISPASVTGMVKKLSSTAPPYLVYVKHRGVKLSEEGLRIALKTLRHHRLLELFLHQSLGFEWDEVHQEAEILEHVISDRFAEKLNAFLGHPELDPHGDPIPAEDLSIQSRVGTPLVDLRPGETAVILRVKDKDPKLLRYLRKLGLVINAKIKVLDFSEYDGNLLIELSDQATTITVGTRITKQIFVSVT